LKLFGFNVVAGEADSDIVTDMVMSSIRYSIYGELVKDLDTLPFPDRSFFKEYYKGPIPVMSHRGCPYDCSFCSKTLDRKVRMRSPENVVEELMEIDKKYPDKEEIIFFDETFTLDYSWVEKLCNLIRSKNLKKRFRCSTRSDRLTLGVAEVLKSAGFGEVCIGVESGSDRILKILNKRTTVEQNSQAVDVCHKVGLKVTGYFMLGCPGESMETLRETENWMEQNKLDTIKLYLYHPLPGSDIWNSKEEYDIDFELDYSKSYYGGKRDKMFSVTSTSHLSNLEITNFYYYLMKKFNLWAK